MKLMATRTIVIPAKYFKITRTKSTVGTRSKNSGRMTGRKVVNGKGDGTYTRRAIKDVDINKDGKTDLYSGQIYGRVSSVQVKASRRAKGYEKQL